MYKMYSDFLVLDIFCIETDLYDNAIKCIDGYTSTALRRTLKRVTETLVSKQSFTVESVLSKTYLWVISTGTGITILLLEVDGAF